MSAVALGKRESLNSSAERKERRMGLARADGARLRMKRLVVVLVVTIAAREAVNMEGMAMMWSLVVHVPPLPHEEQLRVPL